MAGKKAPDIVREILSKQNGGKTAATASSNTKVPGKATATSGSLTAKAKTPTPMAKPGAKPGPKVPPKAPTAVAKPGPAKAAAPGAKKTVAAPAKAPAVPAKAPAKPVVPGKVAAPGKVPAGVRPPTDDMEAKVRKLMAEQIGLVVNPLITRISELETRAQAIRDDFENLIEATLAAEGGAAEEGGEEGEVELTQESIEAMDLGELQELAGQIGLEITGSEKLNALRTTVLQHLAENSEEVSEEPAEDREEAVDLSWIGEPDNENPTPAFIMMEGEWKEGMITEVDPKTGGLTAFIPDAEDPETGFMLNPTATEVAPIPTEEEGEEAAEEETFEEEEEAAEE